MMVNGNPLVLSGTNMDAETTSFMLNNAMIPPPIEEGQGWLDTHRGGFFRYHDGEWHLEKLLNGLGQWQSTYGRNITECIQTSLGVFFWPLDPRPEEILVEDIAHGLAIENRYGNQSRYPYSVAIHSVVLSQIVPEPLAKVALFHDSPEAFLGDVPRPLKRLIEFVGYRKAEKRLQDMIYEKFGLDEPEELHHWDTMIAHSEMLVVMPHVARTKLLLAGRTEREIEEARRYTHLIKEVSWQEAKNLWMQRYFELF